MIHLYYGQNDFAIKRAVDEFAAKFAREHGDQSVMRIDVSETDFAPVLAEIVNISLFTPRRLIILTGASKNKSTWASLGDNLDRVPDETDLIIVEPNPDKRTKTFKSLKNSARGFAVLHPREQNQWTMDEAHRAGIEIKRDAVDELVARTGGNQWLIAAEIAKFAALGKVVNVELVRDFTEASTDASAFVVLDHALHGRRDAMQSELAALRKIEDANKFMGLLASQVFALNVAINANGRPSGEVAKDNSIHPFVMSKMFELARRIDGRDARSIAKTVAETDAKMKLSNADDAWTLLSITLAKIAH